MIRVIVCGGRGYNGDVCSPLDALLDLEGPFVLVHGDAPGADTAAALWAESRGLPIEAFPADWNRHGRAAGPRRNRRMMQAGAGLLVAFPGGVGTEDTVRRARAEYCPVWFPYEDPQTCTPYAACGTHGRCWAHSDWEET